MTGRGPSFCSGGDLDEFGSFDSPADAHLVRLLRSAGQLISMLGIRARTHLHGAAMGAGIELPAFGDIVMAKPSTTIALPEITLGLVPGAGGTVSLPRRIGRHRTAWLALTGAHIDAQTAFEWGLVDEITEDDLGPDRRRLIPSVLPRSEPSAPMDADRLGKRHHRRRGSASVRSTTTAAVRWRGGRATTPAIRASSAGSGGSVRRRPVGPGAVPLAQDRGEIGVRRARHELIHHGVGEHRGEAVPLLLQRHAVQPLVHLAEAARLERRPIGGRRVQEGEQLPLPLPLAGDRSVVTAGDHRGADDHLGGARRAAGAAFPAHRR